MRERIGAMMRTSGMRRHENSRSRGHRTDTGRCGARVILAVLLVAGGVAAASAQERTAQDGSTLEERLEVVMRLLALLVLVGVGSSVGAQQAHSDRPWDRGQVQPVH